MTTVAQATVGGWGGCGGKLLDRQLELFMTQLDEGSRQHLEMCVLRETRQTEEAHLGIIGIWMTRVVMKATGSDGFIQREEGKGVQVRYIVGQVSHGTRELTSRVRLRCV